MAAIDKVKVIVVGDSGVGKTSLTHLICQQQPISNPSWTIGCSVEVKLHEYKEGTSNQRRYFIELWDVGGSRSHKNARSMFYNPTNGIILVHDLTNRKSQQNLQKWLEEVLNKDSVMSRSKSFDDFDPEKFVGSTQIPILVVGTKLDLITQVKSSVHRRSSTIAEECGADEIFMDCRQIKSLAAGSSSSVKISRFFDKVIEKRYFKEAPSPEKRKITPIYATDCRHIKSLAAGSSSSVKLSRFFDKVIERRYFREAPSPEKRKTPIYATVYTKFYYDD